MTLLILALVLLALGAAAGWLLWVNVINNAAYPLGVGIAGAGVALLVLLVLFGLAPAIANRIDAGIAQVRTSTASPAEKPKTDATAVPAQATAAATVVRPANTAVPQPTAVPPTAVPAAANTAVPAPAPTAATTTSVTVGSPGNAKYGSACPTDQQMQEDHGFTTRGIKVTQTGPNVVWDNCKWTLALVGAGVVPNVPLLQGWEYTLTTTATDLPSVWYGADGLVSNMSGATFRYRGHYVTPDNQWVNEPCRPYVSATDKGGLFSREKEYGKSMSPPYDVRNGNLPCP